MSSPRTTPQQRAAADTALLDAYAAFGAWLDQQISGGDAAFAFAVLDRQRRTLGTLLANALDTGRWDRALAIAEPLDEYWNARGLYDEARGWVDRARLVLETADGTPPPVAEPAGALWLFFTISQANRQLTAHHLDAAEHTYLDIRDMLQAQPESPQQLHWLAVAYHQFGGVAQYRGRLEDAEQWYRQSLTITEQLGDRPGLATSYHQLGRVAQLRGRLEDAEQWYRQSLAIEEELGDRPGMALSFVQLGLLAATHGRPEEAMEWMVRCVTLFAEFPHPMTEPGPTNLARLTAELGIDTLERCWHRVTGQPLPPGVRDYIASGPAEEATGTEE